MNRRNIKNAIRFVTILNCPNFKVVVWKCRPWYFGQMFEAGCGIIELGPIQIEVLY
jgi:hypothetical protein